LRDAAEKKLITDINLKVGPQLIQEVRDEIFKTEAPRIESNMRVAIAKQLRLELREEIKEELRDELRDDLMRELDRELRLDLMKSDNPPITET